MIDRHICKAKRTGNGEWVEGYVVKYPTGEWEILRRCDNPPDCDSMWEKVNISYKVDSETVCQCTGLPDKNGRNIFERDIVKEETEIGVVKFGKYGNGFHYGFYIEWVTLPDFRHELAYWNGRVERIGNIFDNPELLKGGAE